ncbi:hypothetical protein INR49_017628 [Caranx melampygus]|nr:hypothetical protein INR49_017628 [Caranx melampygus]
MFAYLTCDPGIRPSRQQGPLEANPLWDKEPLNNGVFKGSRWKPQSHGPTHRSQKPPLSWARGGKKTPALTTLSLETDLRWEEVGGGGVA